MPIHLKNILIIALTFFNALIAFSQVQLTPVVIASAGMEGGNASFKISATIGEALVETKSSSNFIFTQGFHQPSASVLFGNLEIHDTVKNARCLTASDGEISINVINGTPPYTFSWDPNIGTGATVTGLSPGVYFVLVTDLNGREGRDTITVGAETDDMCEIHVYGGITPNGDGINDEWIIDGITMFPENTVNIFNRWGEKVWHASGYDNVEKVWKGKHSNGNFLSDGTYFYILEVKGLNTEKGWVQLTR